MTAVETTLEGRAEAEALMVDTVTITRITPGTGELDPVTGTYDETTTSTVYSGKCKVQQRTSVSTDEVGGTVVTVMDTEVHVPMSVTTVQVGDIATMNSAVLDPALVDRTYRITDDPSKSYATARRLRTEEVQA